MSPLTKKLCLGAILSILSCAPAFAADGSIVDSISMRAGPDAAFPEVMHLARGLSVKIHGCVETQAWCDVTWRGNRGWVQGTALSAASEQMPTVAFDFNTYWDGNYRQRLWYSDRAKWRALHPPVQSASAQQQ